jgi:arabinose-5-phosphate isomerase
MPRREVDSAALLASGQRVLRHEGAALAELASSLDGTFAAACRLLLNCSGRIILTGIGKSGIVARKIAASLTSTGIAAHFLHAAEGMHGDLGAVRAEDVVLAISNSGETAELLDLLGPLRDSGAGLIAITRKASSTLARAAAVALVLGNVAEADPYNLVPSTSTTLTLALGDALTIALMEARGFTERDFATLHPQGMLGKRLTLRVADLLRGEATNPVVGEQAPLFEALRAITAYALGGTSVTDAEGKLRGILTDGDVRRILERLGSQGGSMSEAMQTPVSELMTRGATVVQADALAYDTLQLMEGHQPRPIFIVPVVGTDNRPVGMLHLHALVQAGFKVSRD